MQNQLKDGSTQLHVEMSADPSKPSKSVGKPQRVRAPAKQKPLTIHLSEPLLKKLKVAAVLRGKPVSEVAAGYIALNVKADLKKLSQQLE